MSLYQPRSCRSQRPHSVASNEAPKNCRFIFQSPEIKRHKPIHRRWRQNVGRHFHPITPGIPHDFMRPGNKNGAIWRHVKGGYGCVRNAFRAPLQTRPALRLARDRAWSVTLVSSRPDSSAASPSCRHTSAAGHAARASPASRPQATDRRSTAPRRRGGGRRSGTGWASRWPSRRP